MPPGFGLYVRATLMAGMFAPTHRYDLKNNPYLRSSQEFGNWFYGAAAAQMGFTEQESLTAAAVVQQWQDYINEDHPDWGNTGKMADDIAHAILTGEGDRADDIAPIKGGHSYSKDVYDKDSNADTNVDSCSPSSGGSGETGSTIGGSYEGPINESGWEDNWYIGANYYFVMCGYRFFTTITDWP
jgi:hypothetical protein